MAKTYTLEDIDVIFGVDAEISRAMTQHIFLWKDCYQGNPPWIDSDKGKPRRQVLTNIAALMAWDLAKKAVSEFGITATRTVGNEPVENRDASDFIQSAIAPHIRREVEYAIALGGVVCRPYWDRYEQTVKADWYTADKVIPLSWTGNTLTGVVLIDSKVRMENDQPVTYTKLEAHIPFCRHVGEQATRGYRILNKAFRQKGYVSPNAYGVCTIGQEIGLDAIESWSHLSPEATINNCNEPLFSYMAMPVANNIDLHSPLGVAIYKDAIDQMQELDSNYTGFSWEMRAGESKVFVSDSIVPRTLQTDGTITESTSVMDKSLYKKLDTTQEELIREYAPAFRVDAYVTAIRQNLGTICTLCHLDPSSFVWDAKTGAVTATEIISKNQATYETIVDIQEKMVRPAIQAFIKATRETLQLYVPERANSLLPSDLEYTISFGDSILTDEQTEKATAMNEVTAGLRSKISYLMEYRGLSEEAAQQEIERINGETPNLEPFGRF